MGEVIVVTSGKGGVGKTTTVANIGTGCGFRNGGRWEAVSRNGRSEWDAVSARDPLRKRYPRIGVQNGALFPKHGPEGSCVSFGAEIPGRSFPCKQNKARCLRLMQTARLLRWASLRFEVVACDL